MATIPLPDGATEALRGLCTVSFQSWGSSQPALLPQQRNVPAPSLVAMTQQLIAALIRADPSLARVEKALLDVASLPATAAFFNDAFWYMYLDLVALTDHGMLLERFKRRVLVRLQQLEDNARFAGAKDDGAPPAGRASPFTAARGRRGSIRRTAAAGGSVKPLPSWDRRDSVHPLLELIESLASSATPGATLAPAVKPPAAPATHLGVTGDVNVAGGGCRPPRRRKVAADRELPRTRAAAAGSGAGGIPPPVCHRHLMTHSESAALLRAPRISALSLFSGGQHRPTSRETTTSSIGSPSSSRSPSRASSRSSSSASSVLSTASLLLRASKSLGVQQSLVALDELLPVRGPTSAVEFPRPPTLTSWGPYEGRREVSAALQILESSGDLEFMSPPHLAATTLPFLPAQQTPGPAASSCSPASKAGLEPLLSARRHAPSAADNSNISIVFTGKDDVNPSYRAEVLLRSATEVIRLEQERMLSRMAKQYVSMFGAAKGFTKEIVWPLLPDILGQLVVALLVRTMPYLKSDVTHVEFRRKVKQRFSYWIHGVESADCRSWLRTFAIHSGTAATNATAATATSGHSANATVSLPSLPLSAAPPPGGGGGIARTLVTRAAIAGFSKNLATARCRATADQPETLEPQVPPHTARLGRRGSLVADASPHSALPESAEASSTLLTNPRGGWIPGPTPPAAGAVGAVGRLAPPPAIQTTPRWQQQAARDQATQDIRQAFLPIQIRASSTVAAVTAVGALLDNGGLRRALPTADPSGNDGDGAEKAASSSALTALLLAMNQSLAKKSSGFVSDVATTHRHAQDQRPPKWHEKGRQRSKRRLAHDIPMAFDLAAPSPLIQRYLAEQDVAPTGLRATLSWTV